MRKTIKSSENYCPDKTYQNHAGSGTIKSVIKQKSKSIKIKGCSYEGNDRDNDFVPIDEKEIKQCYNRALISVRKRKSGYLIIVTRQPNTTEESYALAKQLQLEMNKELKSNNYFINDDNGFLEWFSKKEEILKDNGFHKLKD